MFKKNFIHAVKVLKAKKKEIENQLLIIDEEIAIERRDFIHNNAEFKVGDRIRYTDNPHYKTIEHEFIIRNIKVSDEGVIMYDIGNNIKTLAVEIKETSLIKVKEWE